MSIIQAHTLTHTHRDADTHCNARDNIEEKKIIVQNYGMHCLYSHLAKFIIDYAFLITTEMLMMVTSLHSSEINFD